MGRPRSGTAWPVDKSDPSKGWWIQATLPNGERTKPVKLDPGTTEEQARAEAKSLTERCAKGDLERVEGGAGETVSEWWKRYHEAAEAGTVGRKNRGLPQVTVE